MREGMRNDGMSKGFKEYIFPFFCPLSIPFSFLLEPIPVDNE